MPGRRGGVDDDDADTYCIRRFYQDDRPAETILTGLTLEEAKAHCSNPETEGEGFFDGFTKE